MTSWKIFAVDTQFKQLRKRSLKKIQASVGFEPVTSAIPVQCSYQLSYEAITVGSRSILKLTCSQQLWLHSSVGRALHRYRRGRGFESRWSLNFFQASLSQLLKLRINREDLSWRHLLITAVQTQSLECCITLSGMMDPLKLTCSQQLWLHSSVGRALHRYRRGRGFESRWSLNFFQASLSQLLKLRINREDLSWRHLLITAVQTQSL